MLSTFCSNNQFCPYNVSPRLFLNVYEVQWRPTCFLSKYFKISIKLTDILCTLQIYLHNKNILKYVKVFFITESHHTWGMVRVVFSEKSGPMSQDLVAKTLLPLKNFSYMTHSLPKATFRFYS